MPPLTVILNLHLGQSPPRRVDPRTRMILQERTHGQLHAAQIAPATTEKATLRSVLSKATPNDMDVEPGFRDALVSIHDLLFHNHETSPLSASRCQAVAAVACASSPIQAHLQSVFDDDLCLLSSNDILHQEDRVQLAILNDVLKHRPWEVQNGHLQPLLLGKQSHKWSIPQLLKAVLVMIHVHQIETCLRGDDARGLGSEGVKPKPVLVLQDFSWSDHGIPLMEQIASEEVSAAIDSKINSVKRMIESESAGTGAWDEAMQKHGIEDEEAQDVAPVAGSLERERLYLIRSEAKNHATLLHVLQCVSRMLC